MPIVDVHTHFVPDVAVEAIRRGRGEFGLHGDATTLHTAAGALPIAYPELHDPVAKHGVLDDRGIDVGVVSITPHLFVYDPVGDAIEFSRLANDALARYIASTPRLVGLATLPITAPRAAADELERAVVELGLRGAEIGTSLPDGRPLDRADLHPVFARAAALGVPLMLHPYYCGMVRDPDLFMNNSVGVPADTALAAARLAASGTLDAHPGLAVVLPHGGGALPYQLGRLDQAWAYRADLRAMARRPPSGYLDQLWFDSVVHDPRALAFLAEVAVDGHVLLGSDLPYGTGVDRPVELAVAAGLDPQRMGESAAMLFGLSTRCR